MAQSTKDVLYGMLKENTGMSFMDSGDQHGRHWERNQGRDFSSEPEVSLRFSVYNKDWLDIDYTRNLFHFLSGLLEFDPEMNELIQPFVEDGNLYGEALDAALRAVKGNNWITENSCNRDCNLSQGFLFTLFGEHEEFTHCILQIHGGCDVRGGYTKPVVFRAAKPFALLDTGSGEIRCTECRYGWETRDATHWRPVWDHQAVRLEDLDARDGDSGVEGIVVVRRDNTAFCPACGKGMLVPATPEE